jgi:hypothetical protein
MIIALFTRVAYADLMNDKSKQLHTEICDIVMIDSQSGQLRHLRKYDIWWNSVMVEYQRLQLRKTGKEPEVTVTTDKLENLQVCYDKRAAVYATLKTPD